MWKTLAVSLILVASPAWSQDITGDLNTNIGSSNTMDSGNATTSATNNYNSGAPGALSNPVPSSIAPTVMGGGGSDSCLIPKTQGIQLSIIGLSQGGMEQDAECNRRKDSRLLGAPQAIGGLGLQVSGISLMCSNPSVFKAMALANTPCPIMDVVTSRLLIGQAAYKKMREKPKVYIVGYSLDTRFWNTLLMIGRKLPDAPKEVTTTRSLSAKYRSVSGDRTDAGVVENSLRNK